MNTQSQPADDGTTAQGDTQEGASGVYSEIGPLTKVLVHRPGAEIARMTQRELPDYLFDDLLSPVETEREHNLFQQILAKSGAEVVDVVDLLEAALEAAPRAARESLLERVCHFAGLPRLAEVLALWPAKRLAHSLIAGVLWSDLDEKPESLAAIHSRFWGHAEFVLRPVPNLMFVRDPCIGIGDRIVHGHMATAARAREPLLVAFALQHGGGVDADKLLLRPEKVGYGHALEGGDFLVPSEKFVMVGCSERTRAATVELLAKDWLFPNFPNLERVYAVLMPHERSVMHLDTILTQVDAGVFLGHHPMVNAAGGRKLKAVELSRDALPKVHDTASLADILGAEFGGIKMVSCGGPDPVHQEREQWTDGANAVCVSPGHIILYARNRHTVAALREEGFEEFLLHVGQTDDQRQAILAAGTQAERAVFSFSGSELCRARGGGRCLTMPLGRRRVDSGARTESPC